MLEVLYLDKAREGMINLYDDVDYLRFKLTFEMIVRAFKKDTITSKDSDDDIVLFQKLFKEVFDSDIARALLDDVDDDQYIQLSREPYRVRVRDIEVLQKNIATVIETADPDSGESIQARIDELQQQILEKSDRNEDFDAEAQEILRLRQQKENASPNDISSEDMERIRKLQTFITKMPSAILDFDESLVKHLLEKITVFEDKLEFEFKSGITIVIEN